MFVNRKVSKRRSQIRYPIHLDALLIIDKSISAPCVILNFCTAGLFVELQAVAAELFLDKIYLIRFAIGSYLGAETFELRIKVVHIQPGGLGVIIENMPIPAFNALMTLTHTRAETMQEDRRGSSADKLHKENFKNSFKRMLLGILPGLLTDFFDSAGDYPWESQELPGSFNNNSSIDDLITTLNLQRDLFASEFCSSVIVQVDGLPNFNKKIEARDFAGGNSLKLIEKEDFEDWLNLAAVIRKLNTHFEDTLLRLDWELCRIFGSSSYTINNPAGPEILCESFRELVLQLELDRKVSMVLYSLFGKSLINTLPAVYEQLMLLFSRQGSSANPSRVPVPGHVSKLEPDKTISAGGSWSHESKLEQQLLIGFSDSNALNGLSFHKQENLQPVARVAGRLLDILGEIKTPDPETVNNAAVINQGGNLDGERSFFSADEIAGAIASVQENLKHESDDLHVDSGALFQRLLRTLQDDGESSVKSLSTQDARRLEIYGKFFEIIFNELQLSADIRPILESIHLPLLSLAARGGDFLDSETHPARNILNQLAILQSVMGKHGSGLGLAAKKNLEKLIARISSEDIGNPAVLAEVEQELAGMAQRASQSIDNNIKHISENYKSRQKQEIANQLVRLKIDNRISGKFVPAIIPALLETGWRRLLVEAELNNGKAGDGKDHYWRVFDELLSWLFEQDSILKMQAGAIKKSLDGIREGLSSVGAAAAQTDAVIADLEAMLLGRGEPRTRKSIKMVKVTSASAGSFDRVDGELLLLIDQLRSGDWLMLPGGSKGGAPMKLAWISDDRECYVLVNRIGLNKLKLNKKELIMLFLGGGAHKMESLDTPLVERASQLMLQKIHEQLVYTATHDPSTGLLTRDEFIKQLKAEVSKPGRVHHMLCHIEILDFRAITHICGITSGVELQKVMTRALREQLRDEELFAKLGDKSLAILFRHCSEEDGYEIAKKLLKSITGAPFQWREKSFAIDVSIGLAPCGEYNYDVEQLLRQADAASLSAENSGHSRILLFNSENENIQLQQKLHAWAGQINDVFSRERLFLRCQMIAPIDPEKNRHWHYEILLGIRDKDGCVIAPDHFIPAVERCKRMPEIDQWVVRNVFAWIEKNRNALNEP